ncbi:MAG: malto-oligosyltrehalose synthase, partial [Kofleriaceae bacterium]
PSSHDHAPDPRRRRHLYKAVLLRRLRVRARAEPAFGRAIEDELAAINADPVALDAVLEFQNYRLAHWSVAADQLPYRRFFDIATLVGIRTEDPDVFEVSHHRIFEWLADGSIDGVRVDHIDGQRAPAAYLRRVHEAAPEGWLLVEKVLGDGERLPGSWPIDGTSGYDFLDHAGRLFLDPEGEPALTRAFEAYTGAAFDPVSASRAARLEVMSDALHSELARLTELAARACATSPACRDYTRPEIETALAEILAGYATYRTYLGEGPADATGLDRARIARAVAAAGRARPELDRDLLGFLDAALGFELPGPEALELARATQQISGPVVAKGDEDTLSYRQVRLLSRCEVGSHLIAFGIDPAELHRRLAAGPPRSLLATSTHDTKRSEDVRMRIATISELPEAWAAAVARWGERAAAGWGSVEPDRVLEYAMWQSLVGAWPLPLERAQRFAEKATREARLRTSWRRPDPAYEAARTRWLAGVYADRGLIDEIARFALELRPHGDRNSLALLVVKLVAPGIPDVYQGSELRDDSLVDPDNRRPVDLAARRRLLHELDHAPRGGDLGAAKLWTIRRVLALRRASPALFDGEYRALVAAGAHADRVFAFARVAAAGSVVAIVPRLGARADGWRDTRLVLPPGIWRDVLVDREHENAVALADAWRTFPVSVLVRA